MNDRRHIAAVQQADLGRKSTLNRSYEIAKFAICALPSLGHRAASIKVAPVSTVANFRTSG